MEPSFNNNEKMEAGNFGVFFPFGCCCSDSNQEKTHLNYTRAVFFKLQTNAQQRRTSSFRPDPQSVDVLHGEGGVLPQLLLLLLGLAPAQEAVHGHRHQLDLNLPVRGLVVLGDRKKKSAQQSHPTNPSSRCGVGGAEAGMADRFFTHGVGQVRAPDQCAALLAHLQRQRGRRVPLGAVAAAAAAAVQHHHLDHRGCHGDAVADGEGDGVVPAGESGMPVEQEVAGHVAEGEGVAWREEEEEQNGFHSIYTRSSSALLFWKDLHEPGS